MLICNSCLKLEYLNPPSGDKAWCACDICNTHTNCNIMDDDIMIERGGEIKLIGENQIRERNNIKPY